MSFATDTGNGRQLAHVQTSDSEDTRPISSPDTEMRADRRHDRLPGMGSGPRESIVDHPRFGEVLEKALRKNGLHQVMAESVRRLVTGKADPAGFVCCNSGCVPCVKDSLRAAEMVLNELPEDQDQQPALQRSLARLWPFTRKQG
jgi:hypothetical protein